MLEEEVVVVEVVVLEVVAESGEDCSPDNIPSSSFLKGEIGLSEFESAKVS